MNDQSDRLGCLFQVLLTAALLTVSLMGGWLLMIYLFTKKWNHL